MAAETKETYISGYFPESLVKAKTQDRDLNWQHWFKSYEGKCFACKARITRHTYYDGWIINGMDHVENMRPICNKCKLKLGDRPLRDILIDDTSREAIGTIARIFQSEHDVVMAQAATSAMMHLPKMIDLAATLAETSDVHCRSVFILLSKVYGGLTLTDLAIYAKLPHGWAPTEENREIFFIALWESIAVKRIRRDIALRKPPIIAAQLRFETLKVEM
jgi:hypothetical protein